MLGDTVRQQQGEAVFATVERIRQISIAFRRDGDAAARRELEATLDSLSHDRTIEVVRAFSYFSHLANIAEDQHQHPLHAGAQAKAARGAVARAPSSTRSRALRGGRRRRAASCRRLFDTILVSPVLTAHPTEVRRKSVLDREMEVAQLARRARPHAAHAGGGRRRRRRRCRAPSSRCGRPACCGAASPTVIDEVANGLSYYDHTFLRELPRLYGDLEDQLAAIDPAWNNTELPSFIRMGSWIGGDRDGNPFVNADVLRQAIEMQSKRVRRLLSRRAASARAPSSRSTAPA